MKTNYTECALLPINLQAVLPGNNGPERKTRFLLLWSKPSCPILPMSCGLETHFNGNKTAVLKMFQLILIWQWENIVCFDCNCRQTLKRSFTHICSKCIFPTNLQWCHQPVSNQETTENVLGKLRAFHVGNVRPKNIVMPRADLWGYGWLFTVFSWSDSVYFCDLPSALCKILGGDLTQLSK